MRPMNHRAPARLHLQAEMQAEKPDIYLIPPSRTHPDSYGEPIINLLSNYGNIIKVDWPEDSFELLSFTSSISDKINKRRKKVILVGYSSGSLMANLIASAIGSNLKSMYLISYSCDGNFTREGQKITSQIKDAKTDTDREKIMNQIYFSKTDTVSPYIEDLAKRTALSPTQIKNISSAIGKFVSTEKKEFCQLYNVPVYVIYGSADILYGPPSDKVCDKYNCTSIPGAGHSILRSHYYDVYKWLKKYIKN
jgi:hypothetical protein